MSKQTDISQRIEKYLNGNLDARTMHQLEKEAQNDPFLMDALEGYATSGRDQQKNLDDIQERLGLRLNKNKRRIIPLRMIAIAASVIIALTIGGLWFYNNRTAPAPKITAQLIKAETIKPAGKPLNPATIATVKPSQAYIAPKTATDKHVAANPGRLADNGVAEENDQQGYRAEYQPSQTKLKEVSMAKNSPVLASAAIKKDTTPLNEAIVMDYYADKQKATTESTSSVTADKDTTTALERALQGRAAGVNIDAYNGKTLTGIVKDGNEPLQGVNVKVKGAHTSTLTDANGKFSLSNVPANATLDLSYIGYEKKEINVYKPDSLVIAMQPNNESLNEVVAVGYGAAKKDEDAATPFSAHPANGWAGFKKYIQENAVSPDGKKGKVKLSFIINPGGSLTDFKILKSLGKRTDALAIQLIEDGPDWTANTNGKPEKVMVRIKFETK